MRILLLGAAAFAVSLCAGAAEVVDEALRKSAPPMRWCFKRGVYPLAKLCAVGLEVLARDIGCCEYLYKKPGFCVIIK